MGVFCGARTDTPRQPPPWKGAGFVLLSDLHAWLWPDVKIAGERENRRRTRDACARLGIRFAPFGRDAITTIDEIKRGIEANFTPIVEADEENNKPS